MIGMAFADAVSVKSAPSIEQNSSDVLQVYAYMHIRERVCVCVCGHE